MHFRRWCHGALASVKLFDRAWRWTVNTIGGERCIWKARAAQVGPQIVQRRRKSQSQARHNLATAFAKKWKFLAPRTSQARQTWGKLIILVLFHSVKIPRVTHLYRLEHDIHNPYRDGKFTSSVLNIINLHKNGRSSAAHQCRVE